MRAGCKGSKLKYQVTNGADARVKDTQKELFLNYTSMDIDYSRKKPSTHGKLGIHGSANGNSSSS